MDLNRFDDLARVLSGSDSRRRVLGLLTAIPVVGGLVSILTPEETEGKGRRKRRKTRNKRRSGDRKKNRKGQHNRKKKQPTCTPTTCAAQGKTCGSIGDGCGTTLDCGPCTCATGCADCQTCNRDTGQCDPVTNGTACDDGNACTQTDTCQGGICVGSNPVVCPSCQRCDPSTGGCVPDPAKYHTCSGPCPSGEWCDGGACADIQATVRIPDCHSLCGGSTIVCGQVVTCPSCSQCSAQTGCSWTSIPDGPVGPGNYCSTTAFGGGQNCTTNSDCTGGRYCGDFTPSDLCTKICPIT